MITLDGIIRRNLCPNRIKVCGSINISIGSKLGSDDASPALPNVGHQVKVEVIRFFTHSCKLCQPHLWLSKCLHLPFCQWQPVRKLLSPSKLFHRTRTWANSLFLEVDCVFCELFPNLRNGDRQPAKKTRGEILPLQQSFLFSSRFQVFFFCVKMRGQTVTGA